MFKTYVVSLKKEKERRKSVGKTLRELNIDFVFFDAINPVEQINYQNYYNKELVVRVFGRELTNGELGCNISHHLIYRDILEKKIDYALILEDDALLNNDLKSFILSLLEKNIKWDVILLGYSKVNEKEYKTMNIQNPIGRFIFKYKNYRIGKVAKNYTVGTVGYLVSNLGAKKMVDSNLIGSCLADDWEYFEKQAKLKIFHCRPFLVYENYEFFESAISCEREKISKDSATNNFIINIAKYMRGYLRYLKLRFF